MKPEQIINDEADKLQVVQQIPDESKKLIDSIVPYKGHTLFEINCTTGEINVATYEEITANFTTGGVRKKVIIQPNCLYISCLNKKSAAKKYLNWLIQKRYEKFKTEKEIAKKAATETEKNSA